MSAIHKELKAPDRCAQLFDRERSLSTDNHTEVLDCISCVVVFFLSTLHTEPIYRPLRSLHIVLKQESVNRQTGKQTDKRTDGRYQTYYPPCFAVDKKKP